MPSHEKFYLYKRKNQIYYIGYFIEGKLFWRSTEETQKSKALKVLSEFKELLKQKNKPKLLSEFISEFISFAEKNYQKSTVVIFKLALNYLLTIIGDLFLPHITPKHADTYKTARQGQVSLTTVNVELRQLRSAFNTALRWQLIDSNPFCKVKLLSIPEKSPVFLAKDDFEKLISIIKETWLKEIVIFAVLTGMRRGEIINLRWQDIDLSRRILNIQSNCAYNTKQGKRRIIPLNATAFHLLSSKQVTSISEYVFCIKEKKISDWHVSHKFKDSVIQAELNDKLHFHSLRHTFATWLVQDGVNIYEVQKLLGHSSVKVTEVYSHLVASELHSAVNKISVRLN
ncbi:MAG: site-specific integrase [Ignavibacteriales bacterium]|nr:site-specific integrase [Ignavibacteriales bacterium]